MDKKILAVGPYIGDFENEITNFLPYTRWLNEIIQFDNIYINTHYNRAFLYDFIDKESFIPVNESLTRDETNQYGYVNKQLKQKDFNKLIKIFKNKITEKENCSKKDIDIYYLNYVKSNPPCSIYNKIFDKIKLKDDISIPNNHKNRIILIPDKNEKSKKLSDIYTFLKEYYNCLIIGDTKTYFPENNVILSNIDYFENGIQYILKYIQEARAVICPISYWTFICNLQNKPVFSWGNNPGQYREDSFYYFNNKQCVVIPADEDTSTKSIIKNIGFFLKNI